MFRNRIFSLGLRCLLIVEISPELASSDEYILTGNDGGGGQGNSAVHD
jgi:hypothetical protein